MFYTWLTGAANYSGLVADDAIYLLMTERFNPNVENLLVHHYVTEVSHFPPLWPLLLSALDISSNNISKAHWVQNFVISLGVISIGLFSLRLKSGLGAASAIVVLSAASPATLLLSVEIWSEFLFIFLIYLAFSLLIGENTRHLVFSFASLLIGLTVITRGFGIIALGALFLNSLAKYPRRIRGGILFSVMPLALSTIGGWGGNQSYFSIFAERVSSISALFSVIVENLNAIWRGWLQFFDRSPDILSIGVGVLVLVLAGITLWRRLQKFEVDSWFCLGYVALLLIWPFPAVMGRLIFPIIPLLLVYAVLTCSNLPASFSSRTGPYFDKMAPLILCGVLAITILPNSYSLVRNYLEPLPQHLQYLAASRNWMEITDRNTARERLDSAHVIITGLHRAKGMIAESDCVYAQRPQIVMFYLKRPSYPAPTSKDRGSVPLCRYHVLINDGSLQSTLRAMWPNYEVVLTENNRDTPMLLLARYGKIRSEESTFTK